jgi:hypothetical protein
MEKELMMFVFNDEEWENHLVFTTGNEEDAIKLVRARFADYPPVADGELRLTGVYPIHDGRTLFNDDMHELYFS